MELIKELELAYRKLKSFVYHENFSLDLRMEISRFENQKIDDKFNVLASTIDSFISSGKLPDEFLNGINYAVFPKKINKEPQKNLQSFYFSNSNTQDNYSTTKIIPFAKCSVEVHIISVLWIMKIGQKIDDKLTKNCFGNRLFRNDDGKVENDRIHLFQKYYEKYNQWRDEAIKKAKELHSQDYDVAILNLDIKEYYNTVDFDFNSIKDLVPEEFGWLNNLLSAIHEKFYDVLKTNEILITEKKVLPIGLLSSSVIANHYLSKLDKIVENKIKPQYYGRYVDDILIVVANPQISKYDNDPVSSIISKYLIEQKCWTDKIKILKSQINDSDYEIYIDTNKLVFQDEKVKLYHLLAKESIEILNRFESEIIKNSSEFRFQPEAEQIFDSFNAESYELVYSDTVNKIRSIDGIKTNKLGASKHLRKLISATQNTKKLDKAKLEDISQKILDYFSGVRSIELNPLWEKVITFFVINRAEYSLINFIKAQSLVIENIVISDELIGNKDKIKHSIQESLRNHLHLSIAMSSTLNRKFFREQIIEQFPKELSSIGIEVYLNKISTDAQILLDANMFRQQYSFFPLLNYCKQGEDFSYTNQYIPKKTKFAIDKNKIRFSPRFIHYHELVYFYYLERWNSEKFDKTFDVEKKALTKYIEYNKLDEHKGYLDIYPIKNRKITPDNAIKCISISDTQKIENLKVAIANIRVNEKNSINSMLGKPNLSFDRLNELNIILNEALRNKCKMIIFPEICIPYQWVSILTSFARKNDIGVVAGIEHFSRNKRVYNYMLTALPFKFQVYNNLFIDFRLKKDYSPGEISEVVGRTDFDMPLKSELQTEKLRLYEWNGLLFSAFNCFELCDIQKRSKFRGNVDFLVAVEHNRDLEYFSNIVESVSRDVHTYVVQVNTSQYGDSRINQPSESYLKDIVKIKGGENVSILTATIDIKKLREFQTFNFILQDKYKWYKPTPPNFVLNDKRKRY